MDRRRHQASDMADYWRSFLSNGLIHENGQPQISVIANNTNRNITLKKGKALLQGHLYVNTDDLVLRIDNPDSLLDRIDRIVIRYDNTIENRYIKAFVKKGVEASNPIPPQLTRAGDIYEISLAQIKVVAGKSFVEQTDIVDERLNEMTCGLASSLVSVPTDIFNAEFQAYMQQIANEWQTWFNRVVNDTYITNTQFNTRNRQVDRQLANLNAIADINDRAIGNTGTFYDLFDNTNDYSVANMSKPLCKSTLDVTGIVIQLNTVKDLRVNDEINIYGLENLLDTSPYHYVRYITEIDNAKLTITINEIIPKKLMKGAMILRSNINGYKEISNKISFDNFTNLNVISSLNSTSYTNLNSLTLSPDGKVISDGRDFYTKNIDNVFIRRTTSSSTNAPYRIYRNNMAFSHYYISSLNRVYRGIYNLNNIDEGSSFSLSPLTESISDISLIHINSFYIPQLDAILFIEGSSSKIDFIVYNASTGVFLKSTSVYESSRIPKMSGYISDGIFYTLNNSNIEFYKIDPKTYTVSLIKIFYFSKTSSGSQYIPMTPLNTSSNSYFSFNIGGKLFIYNTEGDMTCIYCDTINDTYVYSPISKHPISPIGPATVSNDGLYVAVSTGVYLVSDETVTLITTTSKPLAFTKYIENPYYLFNNVYSFVNGTKEYTLPEVNVYYNFQKPLKNLVGWLQTKKNPLILKTNLSLVDTDVKESYKELIMTNNGKEYEFLEVSNLYEKNKATLKITIYGEFDLEKLLGAIE